MAVYLEVCESNAASVLPNGNSYLHIVIGIQEIWLTDHNDSCSLRGHERSYVPEQTIVGELREI